MLGLHLSASPKTALFFAEGSDLHRGTGQGSLWRVRLKAQAVPAFEREPGMLVAILQRLEESYLLPAGDKALLYAYQLKQAAFFEIDMQVQAKAMSEEMAIARTLNLMATTATSTLMRTGSGWTHQQRREANAEIKAWFKRSGWSPLAMYGTASPNEVAGAAVFHPTTALEWTTAEASRRIEQAASPNPQEEEIQWCCMALDPACLEVVDVLTVEEAQPREAESPEAYLLRLGEQKSLDELGHE
jgi:hypothetical protein